MKSPRQVGSSIYRMWMKFAHALAVVNTTVILTIVYLLLIGPIALVLRLAKKDLLDRRVEEEGSLWKEKETVQPDIDRLRRQF